MEKPTKNSTESAILGLEMQIQTMEEDLGHMTVDLEMFNARMREMLKAVEHVHKKAQIVSLREFRFLKQDIKATDQKIRNLRLGIFTLNEKMEDKLKAIEHYTMLYEQEQEYLARKVLPFVRKIDVNKDR